jgi:hypothetical protein
LAWQTQVSVDQLVSLEKFQAHQMMHDDLDYPAWLEAIPANGDWNIG